MQLTAKEKKDLIVEMRKIYNLCKDNGYTPSANFVKLGQILKETPRTSDDDDAEELYQNQTREEIEEWLECVETNIENEGRGGTVYKSNEKEFIEDMRSRFEEKSDWRKPLTGKQLKWLKALYDRS